MKDQRFSDLAAGMSQRLWTEPRKVMKPCSGEVYIADIHAAVWPAVLWHKFMRSNIHLLGSRFGRTAPVPGSKRTARASAEDVLSSRWKHLRSQWSSIPQVVCSSRRDLPKIAH
ncbi:hypothetical protein CB0940_05670 [Cercospora beticola]|uniref:Uncharacterized protein n=1 Tax=Cercospora beticola TaxID=122368 RepID=A0A2G5HXZ0_CERBT|nr:hypothetical protein CB0940_05670 [Cercospora beticola]PIA97409.1 hypothetical protein CB0940_05670 [Cercospora beticola]